MKPVFDPKWLPKMKEADIPVIVVESSKDQILNDIRRMAHHLYNQPMVTLDMSTLSNHVYPLGPDGQFHYSHSIELHPSALGPGMGDPSMPTAEARERWFNEVKRVSLKATLDSMDLSEYAAPDEKRTINKALRKKRDANKASQNAKGRKWWEHR